MAFLLILEVALNVFLSEAYIPRVDDVNQEFLWFISLLFYTFKNRIGYSLEEFFTAF